MYKKISDDDMLNALDRKRNGEKIASIADDYGISANAMGKKLRRFTASLDEVVEEAGLDPEVWQPKTINRKGSWFQPKTNKLDIERLAELIKERPSYHSLIEDPTVSAEFEAVLPLFDVHVGRNGFEELLDSLPPHIDNKVHIILGGDFINTEADGRTSSGTVIDNDYGLTEMVVEAVRFLHTLFERYPYYELHFVRGNHDAYIMNVVMAVLDAEGVIENADWQADTTYFEVMGNPIVAYHGAGMNKNRIKPAGYLNYTNSVYPEAMGRGTVTWYVGHVHQTQIANVNGVDVRQVPTINGERSGWELANGFVGGKNLPVMDIYRETGLHQTIYLQGDN